MLPAGLQAARLARFTHPGLDVRIVPFRGSYRTLVGEAAGWVNASIYPVPDPRLPFLGVHVTRHVDGKTTAGPTAFLAFAREGYRARALSARDAADALAYPGLWRFAFAHPGAAVGEGWREVSSPGFLTAARRYVPDLSAEHLAERAMGIRAQAMTGAGDLVDDFSVVSGRRVVHVLNASSPPATASFAIATSSPGASSRSWYADSGAASPERLPRPKSARPALELAFDWGRGGSRRARPPRASASQHYAEHMVSGSVGVIAFYVTVAAAATAIGIPAYKAWRASRAAEDGEGR